MSKLKPKVGIKKGGKLLMSSPAAGKTCFISFLFFLYEVDKSWGKALIYVR